MDKGSESLRSLDSLESLKFESDDSIREKITEKGNDSSDNNNKQSNDSEPSPPNHTSKSESNQEQSRGSISSSKSLDPTPPPRKTKPVAPQAPQPPQVPQLPSEESEESADKKMTKDSILKTKSRSFKETEMKQEEEGKEEGKEEHIELENEGTKDENNDIVLRSKSKNDEETPKFHKRASFMMKTKGNIFHKKKGPFSTWKLHYAIVDDGKLHMNFFKSQEEYENLARCKLSIDLRFVTHIKPQKPRILQSSFPFKMQRRAGLSTVKLAAFNEEERAKWITTIEGIMETIKMQSTLESIWEEKRSSTLPNLTNQSRRISSDSETHTTSSAPDQEELIRPKKVSSAGFKLDSKQISSIKLKRVSSEKEEPKSPVAETIDDDNFDPKEKFGVQLRRVQTEKSPPRFEREPSPEYIEFKQKYNSLSLSRKSKSPKLPLNENSVCSHLVENISREEIIIMDVIQPTKESKDLQNRKRSPSPNIPISKAVEAVIKNKPTNEKSEFLQESSKPKFSVCHATSTEISYFESSELNVDESAVNNKGENVSEQPDIVSSTSLNQNEMINIEEIATTKPDIVKSNPVLPKIKLTQENKDPKFKVEKSRDKITAAKLDKDIKNLANYIDSGSTLNDTLTNEETYEINEEKIKVGAITQVITTDVTDNVVNDFNKIMSDKESNFTNYALKDTEKDNKAKPQPMMKPNKEITSTNVESLNKDQKLKYENMSIHTTDSISNEEPQNSQQSNRYSKGIMSQRQIDSIVFGEEKLVKENLISEKDNELHVYKINEDNRSSFLSFQSQVSTESDEPLPKFNFLGRSDRSSAGSVNAKDSLIWEETKVKSSDSNDSVDQPEILREKSLKSRNFLGADSLTDKETRSSLVMPEFTVVEENAEELIMEHSKYGKNNLKEHERNVDDIPSISAELKQVFPEMEAKTNNKETGVSEEILLDDEDKPILQSKEDKISNKDINKHVEEVLNDNSESIEIVLEDTIKAIKKDSKTISKTEESDLETTSKDSETAFNTDEILLENTQSFLKDDVEINSMNLEISQNIEKLDFKNNPKANEDDTENISKSLENISEAIEIYLKDLPTTIIEDLEKTWIIPDIDLKLEDNESDKNKFQIGEQKYLSDSKTILSENTEYNIMMEPKEIITRYEEITVTQNFDFEDTIQSNEWLISEKTNETMPKGDESTDEKSTTVQEKEEIIKEIEYEEAEDYFPTFGDIEYRIKDKNLTELQDDTLRTSGIQGLKEFLKENEADDVQPECKSGISRLGHSPAIEKLRKEMK